MKGVIAGLARGALASGLLVAGGSLDSPQAAVDGRWIVDPVSRCGTTSSFTRPRENIRWYGNCLDGKLHGKGVLIWYDGQIETERNDGTFRQGEFHGDVVTTFPDGRAVYGQYWTGVRHGYFLIVQQGGRSLRATYERGRLMSRREIGAAEASVWRQNWRQRVAASRAAIASQQTAATRQLDAQQSVPRPAPATRDARTSNRRAEPEERGFWSRINPLNWGVVGFFSDLFGGSSDEAAAAMTTAMPQERIAAPVPSRRTENTHPLTPAAPSVRDLPSLQPAAGPTPSPAYGTGYDMDFLLREPHPFARGDGAALYAPATPVLAGYQPLPPTAMRQPPVSLHVTQYASRAAPQPSAASSVLTAQAADNLFLQGYGLESGGDLGGAAAIYEHVVTRYANSRAAGLARGRLNLVRRTLAGASRRSPALQPAETSAWARPLASGPSAAQSGAQIVAANTPFPQSAAASSIGGSRALSMFTNSPWLQQDVCTRNGIYGGETRWCGRVLRDDGDHLLVEVQDVNLYGFGTIGISRSTCTGNTFLTWFSRGTTIRVPKQCLAAG